MKQLLSILIIIFALSFNHAQVAINYKMPDGQILSEKVFDAFKKRFKEHGLEYTVIDSTVADRVLTRIIDIKDEGYFAAEKNEGKFDPFEKLKKEKGQKFKIDKFDNHLGAKFSKNELTGKPTIINFWFTRRPPCIAEKPILLKLQKSFENKLNYIAITFDNQSTVNRFLKKHDFPFIHITDAQEQIDDLEIDAYPITYILDQDGKIHEVCGFISDTEYNEVYKVIENLL